MFGPQAPDSQRFAPNGSRSPPVLAHGSAWRGPRKRSKAPFKRSMRPDGLFSSWRPVRWRLRRAAFFFCHGRGIESAHSGCANAVKVAERLVPMNAGNDELVFVPLGGLGEIGMNLAL